MSEKTHHGRAVKRIREILQIKQDVVADALSISQQSVSLLETKETIDPETLELIAKTLKVPVEAIKNFDEQTAINIIATTFTSHDNSFANNCTFHINPIDKWLEAMEENKKLYERLLNAEIEKVNLLQKILDKK